MGAVKVICDRLASRGIAGKREARRTIVGRYSWEASLRTLDDVLQMAECA